jgi:hypothetical protein
MKPATTLIYFRLVIMKTVMKLHKSQLAIPTSSMGNHFVMQGNDLESMWLLDFENT